MTAMTWREPKLPAPEERAAARREWELAWLHTPENRQQLADQAALAGRPLPSAAAPEQPAAPLSPGEIIARRMLDRTSKTYAWGPRDQEQVLAQMQADRDAARRAALEDSARTARFLDGMPFNPHLLRTVG